MNTFEFKKGLDKNLGGATMSTFQIYKKNKTEIDHSDIEKLVLSLEAKAPKGTKIRVRALNIDRWSTLKGFEDDIDLQNEEDYLDGRAKDTTKFLKAFQLEVVLLKPNKK